MNQFRKDIVSGEWIIIAPGRAKRPHDFFPERPPRTPSPKETCPFEDPQATGNWPPYTAFPNQERWEIAIIPNKYPALTHADACPVVVREGLYERSDGMGFHDLLLFREHGKDLPEMNPATLVDAFVALQERYKQLAQDKCLVYTSTHFNWGESAGASLYHPHFQLLTLPIIPPQVLHSLTHSANYFRSRTGCVHCAIIQYEAGEKARVVAEDDTAIAVTPFASRQPFELKIYPKAHEAHFEDTPPDVLAGVVTMLREALGRVKKHLRDPDLNFFVHTSPLKNKELYAHYHWHIEVFPKVSVPAGFELSTGVQINVVEPETAARMLRGEA